MATEASAQVAAGDVPLRRPPAHGSNVASPLPVQKPDSLYLVRAWNEPVFLDRIYRMIRMIRNLVYPVNPV